MKTLAQYRMAAGLSQKELAKQAGMGRNSIPHFETCKRLANKESAAKLAKSLNIDLGEAYVAANLPCLEQSIRLFRAEGEDKFVAILNSLVAEAEDGNNTDVARIACTETIRVFLREFLAK